jgi:drug/metabolite transporter, DME family
MILIIVAAIEASKADGATRTAHYSISVMICRSIAGSILAGQRIGGLCRRRSMPFRQSFLYGALLALAAGTVFSFGSVTIRLSPHLDAVQYLFWRNLGLLPLVCVLAFAQGTTPWGQMRKSGWLGLAGAVCMTLMADLFIYGMKTTSIANTLLFSSAAPLIGAVLARIFLKEKILAATWLGIAVGVIGLFIMTWGELGGGDMLGNLAALGTGFCYGVYSLIARQGRDRDMSGVVVGWAVLTAISSGLVLWFTNNTVLTPMSENAAAMVHGAVLIGGGMILLNRAARLVGAGQLTLLAQTETTLGPVWVFLLFAEVPRTTTIIGGSVLLAGVLISAFARPRPATTDTKTGAVARA